MRGADNVLDDMRLKLRAPEVVLVEYLGGREFVRGGGERGEGGVTGNACAGLQALSVGGLNETTCVVFMPDSASSNNGANASFDHGIHCTATFAMAEGLEAFAKAGFIVVALQHLALGADEANQFAQLREGDTGAAGRRASSTSVLASMPLAELALKLRGGRDTTDSSTAPGCFAVALQRDSAVSRANALLANAKSGTDDSDEGSTWATHAVVSPSNRCAREELCFLFERLHMSVDAVRTQT